MIGTSRRGLRHTRGTVTPYQTCQFLGKVIQPTDHRLTYYWPPRRENRIRIVREGKELDQSRMEIFRAYSKLSTEDALRSVLHC